jgi:4-aminobutyrate aminotransferase
MAMAKGIASGMPLGAMVARARIMDWVPGSHGSTFCGNPVSCAASLATIALLEGAPCGGGLTENAAQVGAYMLEKLGTLPASHASIGDVRGKGLMLAIELVKDRKSKERAPELRNQVVTACYERGLLLLGCGPNSIRFSPPLIVTREQVDEALAILEDALTACGA